MADEPIILGQQLAAAQRAEADRLAKGGFGTSPIGPNLQYDRNGRDYDLSVPVRLPTDESLATLCQQFTVLDAGARAELRKSLSMDDLYTLLAFGRRSAALGLRNLGTTRIAEGLTALSMVEASRVDWRDLLVALGLLYAASNAIGGNPDRQLANAAALSEPNVSTMMLEFCSRSEEDKSFHAWGYTPVRRGADTGLIGWGYRKYDPTLPLHELIMDLATVIRADKYNVSSVEIGSELPQVWLSGVDDQALIRAHGSIIAGASLHGGLRAKTPSGSFGQFLLLVLVELSNEEAAETLLRLARRKISQTPDFVLLPVTHQRVHCLLIARNPVQGGTAFETQASISRLLPGIEKVLQACSQHDTKAQRIGMFTRLRDFANRLLGR